MNSFLQNQNINVNKHEYAETIRAKAIAQLSKSFRNQRDNLREGNRAVYTEWLLALLIEC
jgi:hypothetical protein